MSTMARACSGTTLVIVPPLTTVDCTVIPRRGSFIFISRAICSASSCTAFTPFSGSIPACAERPVTSISAPPTPLRCVFRRPWRPNAGSSTSTASLRRASCSIARRELSPPRSQPPLPAECRPQAQSRVPAPRFLPNRPPRAFAADFFVGSPQEYKPFLRLYAQSAQSVHCEKRQHLPALHVECARPPGAPSRHTKRHLRQGAERIHRVRVPQHQDLSARAPRAIPNFRAHMIAALPLPQNPHLRPAPLPFPRHHRRALVHRALHVSRRFAAHEFA